MAPKIVVEEGCFDFILNAYFIVDKVALGHAVIMVELVNFARFCKAIVYVFLDVEAIHVAELWRCSFVK
jgi:hypothetical protein